MDKNSVTGLVLITIIIGVFMWWSKPTKEQQEAQQRYQDSIQQVELVKQQTAIELKKKKDAENAIPVADSSVADSVIQKQLEGKFGVFANAVSGEQKFFTLENNKVKITLTNHGAKVYSVEIKDFKTHDGKPLILFDGDQNEFGFSFFHNNRILNTNDLYFEAGTNSSSSQDFKLSVGNDQYLAFNYTLPQDSYMLDFSIVHNDIDAVIQSNRGGFDLNWKMDVPAQEKGRKFEITYSGLFFKYDQDEVDDLLGRSGDETFRTPIKWIAYKDHFFSSILIAKENFASGSASVNIYKEEDNSPLISTNTSQLVIPYAGGAHTEKSFQFYFGPNKYKILKKYKDLDLKEIIPLGWGIFGWVNKIIVIPIFNWLEGSIASYGLIILILTLIIKLGLFPLTFKSYMSTAKMKVLKPQIDEINKKIPAEKSMERQKATMALYQKAGVSPLGGCLPMLLQMPILFAMFRFFPNSIELRQESFLWANDLSSYDAIVSWSANIPIISQYYGNHISLFTLLMGITNIIYTRINQEMTQSTNQMPGMKTMMYLMPVMFLVFFNNYASGLSYYYFISTLITILQTVLIRRFVDEEAILAKLNANQKKPKKKSGFQARIEEMARQQQKAQTQQRKKKK
ncbi:membrane protein insertase YidC [Plebeiibacterium marinum]|uniref:Membrane protein insertase YidC n=1 Tax=Plebeiibacterium marinum TaxID=2992111 RepID=A0AAE3MBM5_9BACT|nr:membrane protein insertase YidC [Plebeiobacterium marinum]MCW3804720.1 membrane protein insertase YidC [Plebeiobacterium marinum]